MTDKQTILISGGTGNVGGGAAFALAGRGARVVLLGRNQERLETRADSMRNALSEKGLNQQEASIDILPIDLSDMEDVRRAAEEAMNRFNTINGLVLSAVTLVQDGPTMLPNGHEVMFATNVMGPFLFSNLLVDRMEQSDGLVLHVINRTNTKIDWKDLESLDNHETNQAYERTKTMHRILAGEMARRYAGRISSVAFDPTFVIDKTDPELKKRWPKGFLGLFWRILTILIAKPPSVAGEPIADLFLSYPDRRAINGEMFKLDKRVEKPDLAMNDEEQGKKLWEALDAITGIKSA